MKKTKWSRLAVVWILVALFFLGGFFWGKPSEFTAERLYRMDRDFFSYAFASDSVYERANETVRDLDRVGAWSGIAAHHLLVADKIAEQIAMLGTGNEKTVVVLSPNHFSLGRSAMQTTTGSWKTPYGNLDADADAVEAIRSIVPDLAIENETFKQEHGVSAIAPFIKRWFSDAKIVAISIHEKATTEQTSALAKAIVDKLPDAIVIASMDMSHNLPEHIASYHDDVTLRSIENGGCDGECALEIDANSVIDSLFEINRLRGMQKWVQTHHGSSLAMGATSDWQENTSHILGHFLDGNPVDDPFVSLHFVGDVMLDRGAREKINEFGIDYPWKEMGRYLMGSDYRVANLEGTISEKESLMTHEPPFVFTFAPAFVEAMKPFINVVSMANNHARDYGGNGEDETHQWLDRIGLPWFGGYASSDTVYRIDKDGIAISLIGYHQFGSSLDDLERVIGEEDLEGRFVIVLPHWGEEYIQAPQSGQREKAKRMIAAGADLIVGGHPHVSQGIETIDEVPVIYSLGNFVFDQEFDETIKGMTVGAILEHERATLYLSLISTLGAQPTPLSDEDAGALFSKLLIPSSNINFTYDEPSP